MPFLLSKKKKKESKHCEALVYSDSLTKYSVLLMWKILEMNII